MTRSRISHHPSAWLIVLLGLALVVGSRLPATLVFAENSSAPAAPMDAASDVTDAVAYMNQYNLIVLDDHNGTFNEPEGREFIGGNLAFTDDATFGSNMTPSCTDRSLTVVGNIVASSTGPLYINNGDLAHKGTIGSRTIFYNGGSGCGEVVDSTLSDTAITSAVQNASTALATIAANNADPVVDGSSNLIFTASTKNANGLAIFDVTAAQVFANSSVSGNIDFTNTTGATTILINVSGTSVNWTNGGQMGSFLPDHGANAAKVLWNFHQATSITTNAREIRGAVLAPLADVNPGGSNIVGSTVVKTLQNTNEIHLPVFLTTNTPPLVNSLPAAAAAAGNYVWLDSNANGVQDSGETTGVAGVTVTLRDSANNVVGSPFVTTASGAYSFTGLTPGSYKVCFTNAPAGYSFSPTGQGTTATDSDAGVSAGGCSATFTLTGGQTNNTLDAGLYQPAAVGDFVWLDSNANGVQDSGETTGVAGVTVTLRDSAGNVVGSPYVTTASGAYSFTGLTPGSYKVCFTNAPAGYSFSPTGQGTTATDSDAGVTAGGCSATFTLTGGQTNNTLDAGLYQPAAVGDFVWLDSNANGVQDSGETTGVAGVTVTLRDSAGNVVGSPFVTTASGAYSFTGLTPGSYKVCFTNAPAGYSFSPTGQGTTATDSDAGVSAGGCSATFTLTGGQTNNTLDAGLYQPAAVGDFVWLDSNANGVQDSGETTGVAGVTVTLRDSAGNVVGSPYVTTASGAYSFTGLTPGSYKVCFTNAPAGYSFSPTGQGTTATDSDAGVSAGGCSATFALTGGETNNTLDAGLYQPAAVGDFVWLDSNANGVQDSGETTGVAGVTVTLRDSAGNVVGSPYVTTASGVYSFTGLTPGSYKVCFTNAPAGYSFSPTGQGTTATDSDAGVTAGGCSATFALTGGQTNNTLDAGLYQPAAVGDYVWLDSNANGVQDSGETTGVAGVTVTLRDSAGNVVGSPYVTTASGAYSFTGLTPGSYKVCFTNAPAGYSFSPTGQGTTATDSDAGVSRRRLLGDLRPDWRRDQQHARRRALPAGGGGRLRLAGQQCERRAGQRRDHRRGRCDRHPARQRRQRGGQPVCHHRQRRVQLHRSDPRQLQGLLHQRSGRLQLQPDRSGHGGDRQ